MKLTKIHLYTAACILLSLKVYSQVPAVQQPQGAAQQVQQKRAEPACLGRFATREEADEFLKTATISKGKGIAVGVTLPQKVTLTKDGRQESGIFKSIDVRKPGTTQLPTGPEVDFKDSWKFELAVYELDKMMNLNMIPPVVERTYGREKGSLQLWIDDCMTEMDRIKKKVSAPDQNDWNLQLLRVFIFDNLVYNIDRNAGNLLVTPDWQIIMIDHTRCFKNMDQLKAAKDLTSFSKSMIESLKTLNKENLKAQCGKYLSGMEIDSVLKRRDKILVLYDKAAANSPARIYP
jgi:hypothetical protein